jgi:hypothetical protein
MSQPWSRDFITQLQEDALDEKELNELTVPQLRKQAKQMGLHGFSKARKADLISTIAEKSRQGVGIDFAGMREYAVEAGLGKWIDPEKSHTADNFELIEKELEVVEEKSAKTKLNFTGWGEALKSALGTIVAIGGVALKTFDVINKGTEKSVVEAADIDKRRGFLGMSSYDVLRTKVAGVSVGLGENAVYDEILGMSNKAESFKILGKGDYLAESLMGVFGTLINADNPYDAYTKAIDQIYSQAQHADSEERRRLLMLMDNAGFGAASSLIGAFLSNPDFAAQYGTPSQLFSLKDNPYYRVHQEAELLTPQIAKLNESLKASYEQMATDWQLAFGVPFKTWWDDTLKAKVVPWFEHMVRFVTGTDNAEDAVASLKKNVKSSKTINERNDILSFNNTAVAEINELLAEVQGTPVGRDISKNSKLYKLVHAQSDFDSKTWVADAWGNFEWLASEQAEKYLWSMKGSQQDKRDMWDAIVRSQYMTEQIKQRGFEGFLTNGVKEAADIYLLQALRLGALGGDDWQQRFDAMLDSLTDVATKNGDKKYDEAVELLSKIATNTEISKTLLNDKSFWQVVNTTYGPQAAEQWRKDLAGRE